MLLLLLLLLKSSRTSRKSSDASLFFNLKELLREIESGLLLVEDADLMSIRVLAVAMGREVGERRRD